MASLREIFYKFDTNNSGTITKSEARQALEDYYTQNNIALPSYDKIEEMVRIMFEIGDSDRDEEITFEEFAKFFKEMNKN
ncbi:hypothetical protein SNEBB_002260 [Seison nebaliae]|nr:hypothetical protein SNEBB_002260 [Seison nebaliae]